MRYRYFPVAVAAAVLAAGAAGLTATSASVAFPGGNGKIIYAGGSLSRKVEAIFQTGGKGGGHSKLVGGGVTPSSSADGRSIVFQRSNGGFAQGGFSILLRGSGDMIKVTRNADQRAWYDASPQFVGTSDDRIVFTSQEDPIDGSARHNYSIWMINADGSGRHPLTRLDEGHYSDFAPTSSPSGDLIVFCRGVRHGGGGIEIYAMRPDGSGVHLVTFSGRKKIYSVDVSPDGTRVVFEFGTPHGGPYGIATASLTDKGPIRVLAKGPYYQPVYSPNGKRVLAQTYPAGGNGARLVSFNLHGRGRDFVTGRIGLAGFDWAPDTK